MDANTEKLIRELAEKFGTTTDHLWQVMIARAPVDAITGMVQCAILVAIMWFTGRPLYKTTRKSISNDDGCFDMELIAILWTAWGLVAVILGMMVLFELNNIISGLFTPEYWALKQILK